MTHSLQKDFARYVSQNILGMIGLSCYILADTFFISQGVGADGLTALNLAIPIYSFMSGVSLMIGFGGATRYTILRSQGEREKADIIFTRSVQFAVWMAAVFVLMGFTLPEKLGYLLGGRGEVLSMTAVYLRVDLLFAPAFILNNVLLAFNRNDGAPGLAMAAMLSASISNIILDWIFIFPLQMGMFGAVLATGTAAVIGLLVQSVRFIRRKHTFRLRAVLPSLRAVGDICTLGVSSLISDLSSGIVIIAFNAIILSLAGNTGVAAYGVVANIALVVTAIFSGIISGAQPLLSSAYGRGQEKDLRKLYRMSLGTALVISMVIYISTYLFASPVAAVFNRDSDPVLPQIAIDGLRLYFTAFPMVAVGMVTAAYFSAVERPVPAFLISVCRGFAVILPVTFLMAALLGMTGVWLAYPVSELITAALSAVLYIYAARKERRKCP